MSEAFMAYPELRHPFTEKPVNPEGGVTVLYGGKAVSVKETGEGDGLLVSADDLTRINGFELKPEGACFDDICIPVREASGVLVSQDGTQWVDLIAFANLVQQPYVADRETGVWSFGEVPARRKSMMTGGMAPEFEVVDRQGEVIRMSDFKGMKALIVTWSSW
jgi:hypothetical protein